MADQQQQQNQSDSQEPQKSSVPPPPTTTTTTKIEDQEKLLDITFVPESSPNDQTFYELDSNFSILKTNNKEPDLNQNPNPNLNQLIDDTNEFVDKFETTTINFNPEDLIIEKDSDQQDNLRNITLADDSLIKTNIDNSNFDDLFDDKQQPTKNILEESMDLLEISAVSQTSENISDPLDLSSLDPIGNNGFDQMDSSMDNIDQPKNQQNTSNQSANVVSDDSNSTIGFNQDNSNDSVIQNIPSDNVNEQKDEIKLKNVPQSLAEAAELAASKAIAAASKVIRSDPDEALADKLSEQFSILSSKEHLIKDEPELISMKESPLEAQKQEQPQDQLGKEAKEIEPLTAIVNPLIDQSKFDDLHADAITQEQLKPINFGEVTQPKQTQNETQPQKEEIEPAKIANVETFDPISTMDVGEPTPSQPKDPVLDLLSKQKVEMEGLKEEQQNYDDDDVDVDDEDDFQVEEKEESNLPLPSAPLLMQPEHQQQPRQQQQPTEVTQVFDNDALDDSAAKTAMDRPEESREMPPVQAKAPSTATTISSISDATADVDVDDNQQVATQTRKIEDDDEQDEEVKSKDREIEKLDSQNEISTIKSDFVPTSSSNIPSTDFTSPSSSSLNFAPKEEEEEEKEASKKQSFEKEVDYDFSGKEEEVKLKDDIQIEKIEKVPEIVTKSTSDLKPFEIATEPTIEIKTKTEIPDTKLDSKKVEQEIVESFGFKPSTATETTPKSETKSSSATTNPQMGRKNYKQYSDNGSSSSRSNSEPDCIQNFIQTLFGQCAADILYWRDPKNTGVVFGVGLVILFSLTIFSVISVVAYTLLFTLLATLSFRVYKNVMQAVNKTDEGHPFKDYLDIEITPNQERAHEIADQLLSHFNCFITRMRSVLLVEDYVESFKYLFLFWALTFIGAWFNGMTLVILAYIGAFSLPKVYEMHQAQIDQYIDLIVSKVNDISEKIPFLKKGTATTADKKDD